MATAPESIAEGAGASAVLADVAAEVETEDLTGTLAIDRRKARRRLALAAVWLLLIVLALGGATYAWFTGNRFTNVTPESYTVSSTGTDLLISTSANGPFSTTATITTETSKVLYPISTTDLANWWQGSFQNPSGITTDYANITGTASTYYLSGTLYLQGSGTSAMNVYLFPSGMSVTSDPQLLAALRLGMVVSGSDFDTRTYIFRLDDLGSTAGATTRVTTEQTGVAVSGSGSWAYAADPALSINSYCMDDAGNRTPTAHAGATSLFTLPANTVATVQYFIYMEGCDENCIDEAQTKDLSLQFAFAGANA